MADLSKARDRRADLRAEVAIWVEERTDDALYLQHATNLSTSGVWLERTLPHPPGTRVDLDLDLPGDGPLRVGGEVVGRRPDTIGMAVRFIDIGREERARIEAFLARQPS